jgi:hypothetical protein
MSYCRSVTRPRERIRLGHVPFPTLSVGKVVGVAIPLAVAVLLVWFALRFLVLPALAKRPLEFWDEVVPAVGISALPLSGAWLFGYLAYLVLESVRGARWLAGTWLGTRRVMRTVWVDLSTAEIETDRSSNGPRQGKPWEQWLVAHAPNGVTVRLQLIRSAWTSLLPASHLTAVAEAITRNRPRTCRHGQAYVVAERIRRLAHDPDTEVHGADTAAPRHAGIWSPIFLLVAALLLLGMSVGGVRWAAQETEAWLDYRSGEECRSSTETLECWIETPATVADVDLCRFSRYCFERTRYELVLADGRTTEASLRRLVDSYTTGDTVDVRVFQDRVVSLHDGAAWRDTMEHPRISRPYTSSFAGVMAGAGLGLLVAALAKGGLRGERWRRRDRDRYGPRHRWGWVGVVLFVAPLPAFGLNLFWLGPPMWLLLLLTAGTAAAVVLGHRGRWSGNASGGTAADGGAAPAAPR